MSIKLNWRWFYASSFNIKFAVLAVAFNGLLVGFINHNHGSEKTISSALVQMLVSFAAGGIGARIVQYISLVKSAFWSYFLASALPLSVKISLAWLGHELNKTPELLFSIVLPVFVSWLMCVIVNYGTRNLQQTKLGRFFFKPPSTS